MIKLLSAFVLAGLFAGGAIAQSAVPQEGNGCPPGLEKKHNGCVPPGQARKVAAEHEARRDDARHAQDAGTVRKTNDAEARKAHAAKLAETRQADAVKRADARQAEAVKRADARQAEAVKRADARQAQAVKQADAKQAQVVKEVDARQARAAKQVDARQAQAANLDETKTPHNAKGQRRTRAHDR